MPGLVPGIHFLLLKGKDVDGRDEPAVTKRINAPFANGLFDTLHV